MDLYSLIAMILVLYVGFRLPYWLTAPPGVVHCLKNWLRYRRWSPCAHTNSVFERVPGVGGYPDMCVMACRDCHTVFFQETWEKWQAASGHVSLVRRLGRFLRARFKK